MSRFKLYEEFNKSIFNQAKEDVIDIGFKFDEQCRNFTKTFQFEFIDRLIIIEQQEENIKFLIPFSDMSVMSRVVLRIHHLQFKDFLHRIKRLQTHILKIREFIEMITEEKLVITIETDTQNSLIAYLYLADSEVDMLIGDVQDVHISSTHPDTVNINATSRSYTLGPLDIDTDEFFSKFLALSGIKVEDKYSAVLLKNKTAPFGTSLKEIKHKFRGSFSGKNFGF